MDKKTTGHESQIAWSDQFVPPLAKRYPRWAAGIAIIAFVVWTLPIGISQAWPAFVKNKTIPEWLAERRWPWASIASSYNWLIGGAYIISVMTLFIFVVLIWLATRKRPMSTEVVPLLSLQEPDGQLEIVEARYGIGDTWNNATRTLKSMIANKRLVLIGKVGDSHRLGGQLLMKKAPTIENCLPGNTGRLVVEQRLSKEEAQMISEVAGQANAQFKFDRLSVTIVGADASEHLEPKQKHLHMGITMQKESFEYFRT
jgi:hypothetical protein